MVSACSGGELVRGEGGKVGSVRKACTSIQTSTRRLPIDAGSGTVSSGSPALSSNMADFSFPTMVRCDRGPRPTPRQRRNRKFLCFEFELPVGTCSTQHRVVRQSGTDQSGRVAVYFVLCKWSKIPPSPLATRPAQPPPPPPSPPAPPQISLRAALCWSPLPQGPFPGCEVWLLPSEFPLRPGDCSPLFIVSAGSE